MTSTERLLQLLVDDYEEFVREMDRLGADWPKFWKALEVALDKVLES